jgi:hypothetical protein
MRFQSLGQLLQELLVDPKPMRYLIIDLMGRLLQPLPVAQDLSE